MRRRWAPIVATRPEPMDDDRLLPAIQAGAAGTCSRTSQPRELARAVARRRPARRSSIRPRPRACSARSSPTTRAPARARLDQLTGREREVLELIARGRANKRIALELGISEKTVKTHVGPRAGQARRHRPHPGGAAAVQEGLVPQGPRTNYAGNRDRPRPTVAGMPTSHHHRSIAGPRPRAGPRPGRARLGARARCPRRRRPRARRPRARRDHRGRSPLPGDVADDWHRGALVDAAGEEVDLLVNNASVLGPEPPAGARPTTRSTMLERVYRRQRARAARARAARRCRACPTAARSSTSPPTPRSSRTRAGAATAPRRRRSSSSPRSSPRSSPALRVYAVDPGDMRTRMHQDAFPGEDISDRPPPEDERSRPARADRGRAAERPLPGPRARPGGAASMSALGVRDAAARSRPTSRPRRAASPATACGCWSRARPTAERRAPAVPRPARAARPPATCSWSTCRRRCRPRSRPAAADGARGAGPLRHAARPRLDDELARGRDPQRRRPRARRAAARASALELERWRVARAGRAVRVRRAADAGPLRLASCSVERVSRAPRRADPLRPRRADAGRSRPTRTSTRPARAAPRCRAPGGRSPPS